MPIVLAADPPLWEGFLRVLTHLLPLWLPLVVGAAAIYLLLPRPQAFPWVWGALAGAVSLVLGGVYLVARGTVTEETLPGTILFYAFSGIAIGAGAMLVTQHNPARAALSFALVILSTCGLFLLLAAPFLMAATIIVYAGAIIVTFLFVLMLAQQQGLSDADVRSREPLLATLAGFVLLGALLYVLRLGYDGHELTTLYDQVQQAIQEETPEKKEPKEEEKAATVETEKEALFDTCLRLTTAYGWKDLRKRCESYQLEWAFAGEDKEKRKALVKLEALVLEARDRLGTVNWAFAADEKEKRTPANVPLSGLSGPPANTPSGEVRRDPHTRLPQLPAENSAYLGRSLFTDFLLPVELGGTLLLVATIGAIAIGQRRTEELGP
jgi:NADH:ubiquinone oxidoreductase subunit 6 (subunit J)